MEMGKGWDGKVIQVTEEEEFTHTDTNKQIGECKNIIDRGMLSRSAEKDYLGYLGLSSGGKETRELRCKDEFVDGEKEE